MGPSTPNFDAFGDGRDPPNLIAFLEASAVFEVAFVRPALAVLFVDGAADDLVVIAERPPS